MPRNEWARMLAASERVDWRIDEVLPDTTRFDFSRPFLPEALVGVRELSFLDGGEQRTLGHVRAHSYLGLFGIVEEMILPFVITHARLDTNTTDPVRALLRFASEEAKHIELFRRFKATFERDFGHPAALVGPADAFANAVLAHEPLSVALAILHIEWMTQRHWLDCVRDDQSLEPAFVSLLRHHWMEEAQHARLDAMLVSELAAALSPEEHARAVEGYLAIVRLLDEALAAQVELDRGTLEGAIGRPLEEFEIVLFRKRQHASMRRGFLVAGMTHREFVASLKRLHGDAEARVARAVTTYAA